MDTEHIRSTVLYYAAYQDISEVVATYSHASRYGYGSYESRLRMMTKSNGKIFRVTGHLCGEFTTQRPVTRSFDVSLTSARING